MDWVISNKLTDMTGLSRDAIYAYKKKGIWQEGVHWRKKNNRIWFNIKQIKLWIES